MHSVKNTLTWAIIIATMMSVRVGMAQDFPAHAKVLDGYTKVVTQANITPMYTLYTRKKDGQMYLELPRTFASKKYYIALTLASGDPYAGLQSGEMYVYWRRYDKRIALMQPSLGMRANGDREAESSVKRLFTDRLLLDLPIVTIGPGGGPVIDADALFVTNASRFFGYDGSLSTSARYGVFSVATAKAFQNNVEIAFEVPSSSGNLKKLHYSISLIPSSTGYKPRVADQRVGYFTTSFSDLGKYDDRETRVRYINRWHIEKADPKLKLSPPKKPIVFYIEHTTPVRYRRWVKDGILAWNKAFEQIGISDAIEVYYQDRSSGAHMDKDPEDVNYNFVRWLNNDIGTAIGPSRVNPLTGQILDADIILTDGWIRHYRKQFNEILPAIAMEGYGADTLAWLADHPNWDPRIRLAAPSLRKSISAKIAREAMTPFSGHPIGSVDSTLIGDDQYDGLIGRTSQINGMCLAADGMSFDMALMKMVMAAGLPKDGKMKSPILGAWAGKATGLSAVGAPIDEMPFGLKFEAGGDDEVVASVELAGKSLPIEDFQFDPEAGRFSGKVSPQEGILVDLEGTLKGDTLSGTWTAKGPQTVSGTWTTSRTQPVQSGDTGDSDAEDSEDGDDNDDEPDKDEDEADDEKKDSDKPKGQMLDGMPEDFVGPLVAHLVAHEVGHTLGLRHNFKASSIYSLDDINGEEVRGRKQLAGSVMDYIAVNINADGGDAQGDYSMTGVGPYDMWAIEYGYTFSDPEKVLERVAEPELAFATDEDTSGPDPLARRYDFSKDPLDYAKNQVKLARYHRNRLLSDFIEDGDSWDRVRYGYELTLGLQTRSASMMANWIGGAFVYRDKKGDPNGRKPVEVVPADQQRRALAFVIENSFTDDAFGITPELTQSMGLDKWLDDSSSFFDEATWPIHDRIMGIQSSVLTMIMNPTTLKRVYDNELRVPANEDSLTLPELLTTVSDAVWSELKEKQDERFTSRKPMISSLRRNLQREHLQRLIDLTFPGSGSTAASRAISMLASQNLRKLQSQIEAAQKAGSEHHDAYTEAHLALAASRIEKALDADFILNPSQGGGGGTIRLILGRDTEESAE